MTPGQAPRFGHCRRLIRVSAALPPNCVRADSIGAPMRLGRRFGRIRFYLSDSIRGYLERSVLGNRPWICRVVSYPAPLFVNQPHMLNSIPKPLMESLSYCGFQRVHKTLGHGSADSAEHCNDLECRQELITRKSRKGFESEQLQPLSGPSLSEIAFWMEIGPGSEIGDATASLCWPGMNYTNVK